MFPLDHYKVNHGMLLNVLSRPQDGCGAMRELIRNSHESDYNKVRLRKLSFQIFRSLIERNIIEFDQKNIRVNLNLQEDFSLFHSLALFLIDTVKRVDPYSEDYALDILTLAESIVENPEVILRKQLDRVKTEKMAQMKMEGVEYDERIAELEKLEYPKPNREFIYESYNEFARSHPWMSQDNIKPKSIVREMYEGFMTFGEYIREYDLQRSEGLLLRYLAEVYKVLSQTVPATAKNEEMESIIDYIGGMIRQVDSSLLDEWEKIRNPNFVPVVTEEKLDIGAADITKNRREFIVGIRNEAFHIVKLIARGYAADLAEWVKEISPDRASEFGVDYFKEKIAQYCEGHKGPLTDRVARSPSFLVAAPDSENSAQWHVSQVLVDEDGHNDVSIRFNIDLQKCRDLGRVVLEFNGFDFQ